MLTLLRKFLVAITPTEQELRIRGLYWKIRLPYRLRMFWRFDVKQYFCKHDGKTYVAADWSYTYLKCSNCSKTMRDLRKDPR